MGSGPPFEAGGDPAADCLDCEGWEEEGAGVGGVEALDSASQVLLVREDDRDGLRHFRGCVYAEVRYEIG